MQEGARNRQALLHSARIIAHRLVPTSRESHVRDLFFQIDITAGMIEKSGIEAQVFESRQIEIERSIVGKVTDHAARALASGFSALDCDCPRRGTRKPGQDFQKGRLAGAVAAEECDELPCRNADAQIAQSGEPPEIFRQPPDFDHSILGKAEYRIENSEFRIWKKRSRDDCEVRQDLTKHSQFSCVLPI